MTDDALIALRNRLERLKQGEEEGHGLSYRETLEALQTARRHRAFADHLDTLAEIDGPGRWDITATKRWPW